MSVQAVCFWRTGFEHRAGLVKLVSRRFVSEEVLEGTEIPGGGGRRGRGGGRRVRGGGRGRRGRLYLPQHCHHQNDSHIKMGNVESRFNALMTVVGKVTRIVSQTHNFSIVLMLY